MSKVGTSNNPNIGIRMGENQPIDEKSLYENLNRRFGGSQYYGIHAPPFIDVFASYNLAVKPLMQEEVAIQKIQQALYNGHVLMAWLQIGFGETIDAQLAYGSVPVIKGEHSVVVTGFTPEGVVIMDPALATTRHLSYTDFFKAMQPFSVPLLEVYPAFGSDLANSSFDPTVRVDGLTGLDRSGIKVAVENAHAGIGKGMIMGSILNDYGYKVLDIRDVATEDIEQVHIILKKELVDYIPLLKRDLALTSYTIASISATLGFDNPSDVIITIGQE